jgi:hypothetical protein
LLIPEHVKEIATKAWGELEQYEALKFIHERIGGGKCRPDKKRRGK